MEYQIEAAQQTRQPYVAIRATVDFEEIGEWVGKLYQELFGWLGRHGVEPTGPPFVRYLEVGSREIELEAGVPTATPVTGDARVRAGVLPEATVARTLHRGPYDTLGDAYKVLTDWIEAHHAQTSGAMWEVYLTDPDTEPDPARWETLVSWPYSMAA